NIEPAFSGHFVLALWNKRHRVGPDIACDPDHFFSRCHLEIQVSLYHASQQAYIFILNMPSITAQMDGYAARSREIRQHRCGNDVGFPGASRLPYRRDVIDVDVQSNHLLNQVLALLVDSFVSITASAGFKS